MEKGLLDSGIQTFCAQHERWFIENDLLCARFKFDDFVQASGFVMQVALLSEQRNHHPSIDWVNNRVKIGLATHDAGGDITEKDIDLAQAIEGVL